MLAQHPSHRLGRPDRVAVGAALGLGDQLVDDLAGSSRSRAVSFSASAAFSALVVSR